MTSHLLPTSSLLAPYPHLQALFAPLGACIRRGDLAGFDTALAAGQDEFVKRRVYLTLERGRDIALRNLFRHVFLAGGYEEGKDGMVRRSRVPITEFMAGMRVGLGTGQKEAVEDVERDEVECLIAKHDIQGKQHYPPSVFTPSCVLCGCSLRLSPSSHCLWRRRNSTPCMTF